MTVATESIEFTMQSRATLADRPSRARDVITCLRRSTSRNLATATVVAFPLGFAAHAAEPEKSACHSDAILVFDASGSMASADPHGNVSRIHRIREATAKVVPNVASLRNLGLMVYGGGGGASCTDISLKVRPAPNNAKPILDALRDILPNGRTPLTESVSRAAEELHFRTKPATVVLLTDGEESCGGDPCRLGERLHKEGANTRVHVIDYKTPFSSDWRGTLQSRCLATSTGGLYMPVNSVDDLIQALRETLGCPYITQVPRRFAGIRTRPAPAASARDGADQVHQRREGDEAQRVE